MIRRAIAVLLLFQAACSHTRFIAEDGSRELTLRYDSGLSVWTGETLLAESPGWTGLSSHVDCVENARFHAAEAEDSGAIASSTRWLGFSLGLASLGTLGGAVADDKDRLGIWLGAGLSAALVGLVMAVVANRSRDRADGNAVDAINFYNDAVHMKGLTCGGTATSTTGL